MKHPLSQYVVAVVLVLAALNAINYFAFGKGRFKKIFSYSVGFLLGMLAMYIAVHIYQWQ